MDQPKPDPNCRWCRGTGEVALIVTSVPCDCLKVSKIEEENDDGEIKLADEDDGLGSSTNTGYHI